MGIEDWRINEVSRSAGGDPTIRFVEMYAPASPTADNCLFASSRIELLDGAGTLIGEVYPVTSTICLPGDFYYMFATDAAAAFYGFDFDRTLNLAIPESGQLCFKSSGTRYDCARWGTVTSPVTDLADPGDVTTAATLTDGKALARRSDTGVVAADFVIQDPTPRQPNSGGVWNPPDAGLPPDADVTPDADPTDAHFFADAQPVPRYDAREEPGWFAADPGGGASISCQAAAGAAGGGLAAIIGVLGLVVAWRLRGRR